MPVFDSGDIDYLLNQFDLQGLRRQMHACDVQASVCRTFGEDDWSDFYADLKSAMELAVDILYSMRTRLLATPRPGQKEVIDVEIVKQRNDVVSVVGRYTQLRKSGSRFNAKCPTHESKGLPLTVYPDNQSWYCFHCQKGGDVVDAVMTFQNVDFQAAIETLK